jgi:hypothetical protein
MGLAFFQWCEGTFIGEAVRTSVWLFPIIEAFHLLGLSLLGGAVLVLDLRLVGVMLGSEPIAELARSTRRWAVAGVIAMIATGVPLFLSEPVAIGFTIAVRRWIARTPPAATSPRTRLAGATSMLLWFTVAAAGRWIGFSS